MNKFAERSAMNTYTPREGSVACKTIQFLQANTEEQLDADIIAAKFDCDRRNVHTLLGPAVQAGLLVRAEDPSSGELVYGAGPGTAPAPERPPASGFHGWLERKGQPSAEGRPKHRGSPPPPPAPATRRSTPFWIDPATVQIDKGVAMPGRGKSIDWTPLLDRLEVGDSFLLPQGAKSAIGTAMKAFKDASGRSLASRKVEGGIRVWRVA